MNFFNSANIGGAAGIAIAPNFLAASTPGTAWTPADMFPGWSEDGTLITVPIAAFNLLTAATADNTTGDARQVASSICSTMFEWYNELTTVPEGMEAKIWNRRIQTTGDFEGSEKITYQFVFYRVYPEQTMAAEPTV